MPVPVVVVVVVLRVVVPVVPVVRSITRGAAKNDYRFSSLVMGIVTSPPFQMRVKKAEEQP